MFLSSNVKVGERLTLTARATDDGIPKPSPAPMEYPSQRYAQGLRVAWFVYRGAGKAVTFDPEQFRVYPDYRRHANSPWRPGWAPPPLPPDGKFPVTAVFSEPGTFVVRVLASDGGLSAYQDITVQVLGASQ